MLDINGGELLVLLVVGVIVLGPERLPQYAAQLARFVRQARSFARTARDQMREELGEDFDDIDWESLDPRRYDPRRIVREALLDDDESASPGPRGSTGGSASGNSTSHSTAADVDRAERNGTGEGAQTGVSAFDPDAT